MLGLPTTAKPAEAQALLSSLEQLFGSLDNAAALRTRVEGMELDRDEFVLKAHAFVADLALDLAEMPPEQAVGLLNKRRIEAETRATRAAS